MHCRDPSFIIRSVKCLPFIRVSSIRLERTGVGHLCLGPDWEPRNEQVNNDSPESSEV